MTSPTPAERDPARFNAAIRQLYKGGSNNTGMVTLRANQTTTVVNHQSCNPNSHISMMPLTAGALRALLPAPKMYLATRVLSLATGNVAYTGLGFKPTLILFQTGITGVAMWGSTGSGDGTNNECIEFNQTGGVIFQANNAGIQRDNAGGTNFQSFTVASMDVDGFTLAWSKIGTPTATATINALCHPETGVSGVRVSARTTGSFTLTHASNAAVDQTFTYSITGGA